MRSRRRRRRAPRPRPEDLRVAGNGGNGGVVFRIVVYLSLSLVGVGSAVLSKHEENIHHEVSPSSLPSF